VRGDIIGKNVESKHLCHVMMLERLEAMGLRDKGRY